MSVIELLGGSTPRRVTHAEREREQSRVERDEPDHIKRRSSEQFAQVLALLAGTGSRARIDLLKQMPAEGASVLDRLLTQANVEGGEGMTESNTMATDAASAMRYGILKRGDDSALTRALQDVQRGGTDALARIASRRGASVEELMALGDTRTAELKQALDALLSKAGHNNGIDDPILSANIAAAAFASALAEAHATSASDVNSPVRDQNALAPEFRDRLARVIERMKNEFGHDVSIVETARSQERQDHLFEQGRSRPGPVVTWTRDSAHIEGFAADVVVDDKWNNPQGYARLQQIAREEGLRTLGARDQGHLELPRELRTNAALAANTKALRAQQQLTSTSAGETTYAQGIARVAGVAQVAGVASVGTAVSEPARSMAIDARATSSSISAESNSSEAMMQQGMSGEQRGNTDSSDAHARSDEFTMPMIGPRQEFNAAGQGGAGATAPVESASFDRVLEAQKARDNAPARQVSQLTLQVDAPDGSSDEITIGMRGKVVDTHIVTDTSTASRLRANTGELQHALGRHGLEADTVRISSAGRQELQDAAKNVAAGTERDALRAASTQQAQNGDNAAQQQARERTGNARDWQERQEARRERDEQRQSDAEQRRTPFNKESR